MRTLVYKPTEPLDAWRLANDLRWVDRMELQALSQEDPLDACRKSIARSDECWSVWTPAGELVCVFGIVPVSVMGALGGPWLLGTDLLDEYPIEFIRSSRRYVRAWLEDYVELRNIVWYKNTEAIKYLEAVGFTVDPPLELPGGRDMGRVFHMRASNV